MSAWLPTEAGVDVETEVESGRRTGRATARDGVVEVVTRGEGRRVWSPDQKRMIVVEAMQPGATPTEVMRRWGISSGMFYGWRRQVMNGEFGAVPTPLPAFARVEFADGPAAAPEAEAPVPAPSPRAPTSPSASSGPPARMEVVLPCGTVLRLDEDVGADALRRVLAALRGR